MLILIVIALIFIILTAYDNRLLLSLYLIYVAFISNNSSLMVKGVNISYSVFYLFVVLAVIVLQKILKKEAINYISFASTSKMTISLFLISFVLPYLWNIFYFHTSPNEFLSNHAIAGVTFLCIGCLNFKEERNFKTFFKLYSIIGAVMICAIAPQSLFYFFKSGGLGFGRFRTTIQISEMPYVWAYKIDGDTYLLKTSTHGSYLLSFFSAILISSLTLRYFKSDSKRIKLTSALTMIGAFFIVYINQYVTTTLILALNALLASTVCYYFSKIKRAINLIPFIISIALIIFTLTPSSKLLSYFSVPVAQVDVVEKLSLMKDEKTPNESVNRITLLYRSFLNLREQRLLLKGIGIPVHINTSNHHSIEATKHTFGLDYLIYFGIIGGIIVIFLKLFLIWFEPLKRLLNKPSLEEFLYILNVGAAISTLFLIGRLDYFKWSLLTILGLWLYPILSSKSSQTEELKL